MLGLTLFGRYPDPIAHTDCSVMFNDPATDGRVRVLVLLIGLDAGTVIGSLAAQIGRFRVRGREPVFVADQPCFEALREHNVVVEILPTAAMLKECDPARYAAYITAKLASIRESWLITEEVSVGRPVETLLAAGPVGAFPAAPAVAERFQKIRAT
jgi:hypothetical protein